MLTLEAVVATPILLASFLGSPHCAGMCGGFVAIYAHKSHDRYLPHLLYNLGRLTTYLSLGIIAATLGAKIDSLVVFGRISAFIVGITLIAIGTLRLLNRRVNLFAALAGKASARLGSLVKAILQREGQLKPFLIGFITTFIPCGWLYSFVALALASADLSSAVLIMALFWLGTLPLMISLGLASRVALKPLTKYLPTFTAVMLILSGIASIMMHLEHVNHGGHDHHDHHSMHN